MYKSLFVILFCCCMLPAQAQDSTQYTDATGEEEIDSRDILSDTVLYINEVEISPDSVAAWKKNKRFAYMSNLDSLLKVKQQEELNEYQQRLKEKPNNFLSKLFASGIPQLIFWLIAIAFVLFILYRLFVSNGIFRGRSATRTAVKELPTDEVVATVADYDKLIRQSLQQGNYRLTVRYLFLKTLVHLSDHDYIQHAPDKTDYQYVQEIRQDLRNEFAALVLNYEYVWYGNFPLGTDAYSGIEKKFRSFYSKIQ